MWWKVLGVEMDATLKEVKRAYAKLIKVAYQSDDQNEIIKIQDAYKSGCEYIKSKNEAPKKAFKASVQMEKNVRSFNFEYHESTDEQEIVDNYDDENIDDFKEESLNNTYQEKIKFKNEEKIRVNNREKIRFNIDDRELNDESHNREKIKWEDNKNDEFIYEEVQSDIKNCEVIFNPIYTDMRKRFDIEKWKELFGNFSANQKEYFEEHGYKYFNGHYQLPYDIWLVIEENLKVMSKKSFRWKEKLIFDDTLEYYYSEGYSYDELEKFFKLRSEAYGAYMNMEYKRSLSICDKANKINSKDPGIIKLRGLCNYDLGNYKLSYWNFKELQTYDRYEIEAKRCIADIYWKNKEFEKANELYDEITIDGNGILKVKKRIKSLKNKIKKSLLENKYVKIIYPIAKVLFYVVLVLASLGIFLSMIISSDAFFGIVPIAFIMCSIRARNKS